MFTFNVQLSDSAREVLLDVSARSGLTPEQWLSLALEQELRRCQHHIEFSGLTDRRLFPATVSTRLDARTFCRFSALPSRSAWLRELIARELGTLPVAG